MAIPAEPTVSTIVTDALKHAGIYNPSPAQITELTNNGFQTVKTELWSVTTRDRLLETSVLVLMPIGSGQVDTPTDFDHVISVDVYSCAANMAFTATAGSATSITAPTTFSGDVSSIRGRYLFLTGGFGSGVYRQITNYNDTTKVLTFAPAVSLAPNTTTTAFVGQTVRRLDLDDRGGTWTQGYPSSYRLVGQSALNADLPAIELMPVPDTANYAMILTYGPNLTRLDETSTVLVKHLRERRTFWIQGLVAQAARRYDEARYPTEDGKWQIALQRYAAHNPTYSRMESQR